ncbi:DNA helicase/exodeoxyribonuclease V, alpha subunit [Pseudoxanthomonas sp. GM95]|uniref:exodeoxyribonuclease V subunit alpha n=1 Tax=Pseudoxanthomonas sp. GM95 TaxID=1881043 RepID=UPI0008C43AC8|nr:exodeoxyribonuclease V subunit alpha [Pseudoxanthomonas sp. GM95]SEM21903.1 DNA helicase/exodeoxyribonuclease V, alpha subunit [Pseudoxanthomonas sp. GM95]
MSLLNDLMRAGVLRTLDHAFAQSLRRLDPDTPDEVLAAAALASLAVAQGHAGFDPARPQLLTEAQMAWPGAAQWQTAIAGSRWVAQPGAAQDVSDTTTPLVSEHGLLYLRRYREYERRLAMQLQHIAAQPLHAGGTADVAEVFALLFPHARSGEDRQARAAALALRRALLLVTGGPGTGKTTTITRLLVLRIAQAQRAGIVLPRIALAAPTGRAAERMAESLRKAAAAIVASGVDAALCEALPDSASTLHRLLGTIPDAPTFRHTADNPLPFNVIVVDEASMVDLPLMCKLVEAVADGTQLILLGDPDQLPSVEAGDVLAAILAAAGPGDALSADDARALQPLLGDAVPMADHAGGLHGHRVQLLRGYRQDADFDLAPLAVATREGDAERALSLLRGDTLRGVHFHEDVLDPLETQRALFLAHWRALADAPDPATALQSAQRLRLLTAVREGPQGARGLNARIEELLSGRRIGSAPSYFHGRLLLVTENSYRHRLFNGDIGICLRDGSGALMAWFAGGEDGGVRPFHPSALPAHESAFAMTVHKAQGSEFDEVWLQLPRNDSRVLSRELVYTALTRARTRLHVAGNAQVLRDALARHAVRMSGLAWRLGERDRSPTADPLPEAMTPVQGALF